MSEILPTVNLAGTGYVLGDAPAFERTFIRALSFHRPEGLAAVLDASGAYHIDARGASRYAERYVEAYGFYDGAATVRDSRGYFHIDPEGRPMHRERFLWAGNYQEGLCVVQDERGFLHVDLAGAPAYRQRYAYVGDFVHGVAVAHGHAGAVHIRRDGSLLNGTSYRTAGVFHKGFAVVRDDRGCFHVDLHGNAVHAHRFRTAEPFYNGVALCEDAGGCLVRLRQNGYYAHLPSPTPRIDAAGVRARLASGDRVGLFLRHAERHPIVSGWGNEALPTEAGLRQARKLGAALAGPHALRVFSSSVDRCMQTGQGFSEGAGATVQPEPMELLGNPGPFQDPKRQDEFHVEPDRFGDFAAHYLRTGRAPGMLPLEEACHALLRGLDERLGEGLTLFVTHDLFAAGLLAFLGLKHPTRHDWADYLEGVCIARGRGDRLDWRWFHGLEAV